MKITLHPGITIYINLQWIFLSYNALGKSFGCNLWLTGSLF